MSKSQWQFGTVVTALPSGTVTKGLLKLLRRGVYPMGTWPRPKAGSKQSWSNPTVRKQPALPATKINNSRLSKPLVDTVVRFRSLPGRRKAFQLTITTLLTVFRKLEARERKNMTNHPKSNKPVANSDELRKQVASIHFLEHTDTCYRGCGWRLEDELTSEQTNTKPWESEDYEGWYWYADHSSHPKAEWVVKFKLEG